VSPFNIQFQLNVTQISNFQVDMPLNITTILRCASITKFRFNSVYHSIITITLYTKQDHTLKTCNLLIDHIDVSAEDSSSLPESRSAITVTQY